MRARCAAVRCLRKENHGPRIVSCRLEPLRRLLVLLTLGAAACGAHAHETSGASGISKTIELPAREFHEECLELTRQQQLYYVFRSTQPVDFNIHYHRGNDVFYPVRLKKVRRSKSAFSPRRDDGYCLMWTNAARSSVKLEYQLSVRAAPTKK